MSLEILVLLALAQQQQGDVDAAVTTVARALELAEPEGYLATFTDEGPAMAALLSAAAKRGVSTAYVARLLRSQGPGPLEPPQDRTSWSTRSANASSTCSASWRAS